MELTMESAKCVIMEHNCAQFKGMLNAPDILVAHGMICTQVYHTKNLPLVRAPRFYEIDAMSDLEIIHATLLILEYDDYAGSKETHITYCIQTWGHTL